MIPHKQYPITLQICPEQLTVCRLTPKGKLPDWVALESNQFISITKTHDELSIVCDQAIVPTDVKAQRNWRMLKIKGVLDFSLVGILKRVITPLSENEISIYALSTYDTDYILIQEQEFEKALGLLRNHFTIENL